MREVNNKDFRTALCLAGLTISSFADRLGVTAPAVHRVLGGHTISARIEWEMRDLIRREFGRLQRRKAA